MLFTASKRNTSFNTDFLENLSTVTLTDFILALGLSEDFTTKVENLISLLFCSGIMLILHHLIKITSNNSLHTTSKTSRQRNEKRTIGDCQNTHVRVTRLVTRPALNQSDS